MNENGMAQPDAIESARSAIIEQLRREWPYPLTITPQTLPARVPDRVFIEAAARLQEDGLIMYEALLIGAGPSPQLIDAALTRRGQLWNAGAS
jgi:hypothetical protein